MEIKKYKIAKISEAADKIKLFILEPVDGIPLDFKPGQFVKIYDCERKTFRPYSLTSMPHEKNLEFAIKIEGGSFTSYLDGLKVGAELWIEGPLGKFYYEDEPNAVFIAGGVGIAPIIGMIRVIISQKKKDGKFILIYSAKTLADLAYFKELKEICTNSNGRIKVIFTLTQERPDGWGITGGLKPCGEETGRVDEKLILQHVKNPGDYFWYICGPLKMTFAIKEILLKESVQPGKIKIEGWG